MKTNINKVNGGASKGASFIKQIIFGIFAVTVLIFSGCGKGKSADGEQETIKIGAILPLTGKYSDPGNGVKVGLEFAVRELNAKGKANYQIEYYDTQSEAKNALIGYARLKATNKINVFFTTMGDHSMILKPEAIKNGNLLFCVSAHPDITKDNRQLVYRLATTAMGETDCMLRYIEDSLHSKRIFTYSFNNEACLEYVTFIKAQLESKLIGSCLFDEDTASLRNITTVNTYKDADCITVIGTTPAMGLLIKFIRESGYAGAIITSAAFNQPTILTAAGDYAKNVSFVDYDFPFQSAQHKKWNDEAQATYKSSFSIMSYHAYGMIRILDEIYSSGVHSPQAIGERLSENKTYEVKANDVTLEFIAQDGGITTHLRMR